MSYTYTTLADGHILIMTMPADFNMVTEVQAAAVEALALIEQSSAPIVHITDARELVMSNLNDLLEGANAVRHVPHELRVAKHPKVIKSLAVINNRVLQVAAKGLNSVSFGHLEVTMFGTLDEALVQARALLKEAGYDGLSAAG